MALSRKDSTLERLFHDWDKFGQRNEVVNHTIIYGIRIFDLGYFLRVG